MRGKVLLGWLTRENAIRYLQNDCVFDPPLTAEQAEALWAERKAVVDGLNRPIPNPSPLDLTQREREARGRFLAQLRNRPGPRMQDVVKLDPRGFVVRQFDVNLDHVTTRYAGCNTPGWCIQHCLPATRAGAQISVSAQGNDWSVGLPHGEFGFGFNGEAFVIVQGAPHVAVSLLGDRTLLWSGYHRCYARASTVSPEIMDRAVLAAVTPEWDSFVANASTELRDSVLGLRPALLGDFFDDRLFMEVELRRKRYEFQIRANLALINLD